MILIEEIEIDTNVSSAILESRLELLPDEIRRDSLTHWILEFDSLEKERHNREYSRENREDSREKILEPFIAPILQSSLTPNVSFYFASLFHIGRQWKRSERALQSISQALQSSNLEATIARNIPLFQDELQRLDVPEEEHESLFSEALTEILQYATNQHILNIRQSQRWWQDWKREVDELKNIIEYIASEYDRESDRENSLSNILGVFSSLVKLIAFSFQRKNLYYSFSKDDVTLKNLDTSLSSQNPITAFSLIPLIACVVKESHHGNGLAYFMRDFVQEYHYSLRMQSELQNKQRYTPIIQRIESQLLDIFRSENPFSKYDMLKSQPDSFLTDLWNKCKLPNEEMFYYATNWKDSLEPAPYFGTRELPFKSQLNENDIESYARSLDSTIKRGWVSETKIVGETDTEFSQRLFEQKWIAEIVRGAVSPTKEKKGSQKWSVESIRQMIERVVQSLNVRGYALETPAKNRLERLWNLAIRGDTYRNQW